MRLIISLSLLCFSAAACAEVYRWIDPDGTVHYEDKAPSRDAQPAKLPPLQVISGGASLDRDNAADTAPASPAAVTTPATFPIMITSPLADQTVRGADRVVTVIVSLQRPLPEGAGLVYYLDGNAQNQPPVPSFSFAVRGVDRGSHMVEVAAVDGRGKELGRAAPVIVHVMPPGLK